MLVWKGLLASPDFEVVRLKKKIGQPKKAFNMHANVLFILQTGGVQRSGLVRGEVLSEGGV